MSAHGRRLKALSGVHGQQQQHAVAPRVAEIRACAVPLPFRLCPTCLSARATHLIALTARCLLTRAMDRKPEGGHKLRRARRKPLRASDDQQGAAQQAAPHEATSRASKPPGSSTASPSMRRGKSAFDAPQKASKPAGASSAPAPSTRRGKAGRAPKGPTAAAGEAREAEEGGVGGTLCELEQHVLPWRVDDICNDQLLSALVRPIPTTFTDVPTYLAAFRWPLIDECRASLKRALHDLPPACSLPVTVRALTRVDGGTVGDSSGRVDSTVGFCYVDLEVCRAVGIGEEGGTGEAGKAGAAGQRGDGGGAELKRTDAALVHRRAGGGAEAELKPTDVLLLSSVPPSRPPALLAPGVLHFLALLVPLRGRGLRGKIVARDGSREHIALRAAVEGGEQAGAVAVRWYATPLGCLATPLRVWAALQGGEEGERQDVVRRRRMLRALLCSKERQQGRLKAGARRGGSEWREVRHEGVWEGKRGRGVVVVVGTCRIISLLRSTDFFLYRSFLRSPSPLPLQQGLAVAPAIAVAPHEAAAVLQAVSNLCTTCQLNHSQHAAVLSCLSALLPTPTPPPATALLSPPPTNPDSTPLLPSSFSAALPSSSSPPQPLQLVQGPPGTGKTHMLAVLLWAVLSLGVRTLVCAPTNVAAAEVARRMLRLALAADPPLLLPQRFCQPQPAQSGGGRAATGAATGAGAGACGERVQVGDMVLVANEERVDVDGELSMLFLGTQDGGGSGARRGRVWRLQAALSGLTGWRGAFCGLMGVLQWTGEQLRVEYEGQEGECGEHAEEHGECLTGDKVAVGGGGGGQSCRGDGKAENSGGRRREAADLLSFFRERVGKLVNHASEAATTLAQDLPSALLPAHHHALLLQAADLLPALLHVLACPGLAPTDVLQWLDDAARRTARQESKGVRAVLQEAAVLAGIPCGIGGASSYAGGKNPRRNTSVFAARPVSSSSSSSSSTSITNDADASLDHAAELFHAICHHLQRIHAASPAFNLPGLSSSSSSWESIADACVKGARLVLSTVSSSARSLIRLSGAFPLLLLDEAAQLVEAEALVALQAGGVQHAVLVGDPRQLPATVMSKLAEAGNYNRSLFERLQGNGWAVQLLSVQYRMHPSISAFPSRCFYRGRIQNGANVCRPQHSPKHLQPLFGAYRFFHVKGREERQGGAMEGGSRSIGNSVEAALVLTLLHRLAHACRGVATHTQGGTGLKVGVISPYKRQVEALQGAVQVQAREGAWRQLLVEAGTVDGFQGRECDVIILSTVRCNTAGSIGFVADPRRLNVAVTRAHHAMWVVGDGDTLRRGNRTWEQLLVDAERRGCVVSAHSDPRLQGAVRTAHGDRSKPGRRFVAQ
ncbi:unnamed protein product [Closterium sp. Naga37s-1]|nr:unnamed protein product [Closterium sp. Naga37s-1]